MRKTGSDEKNCQKCGGAIMWLTGEPKCSECARSPIAYPLLPLVPDRELPENISDRLFHAGPGYFGLREAADELEISRSTIRSRAKRRGILPTYVQGHPVFTEAQVVELGSGYPAYLEQIFWNDDYWATTYWLTCIFPYTQRHLNELGRIGAIPSFVEHGHTWLNSADTWWWTITHGRWPGFLDESTDRIPQSVS